VINSIYIHSHHVDRLGIQDVNGNNTGQLEVPPQDEDAVDSFMHDVLVHPHLLLACNITAIQID